MSIRCMDTWGSMRAADHYDHMTIPSLASATEKGVLPCTYTLTPDLSGSPRV